MKYQNSLTDEKLIQFYLNSEPNAMATLIELHKDRVYRSIYNMVQDKHVAEEIFGDLFISIINNMIAGNIAEDGNFLQWAKRIAHNLCVDHFRKIKSKPVIKTSEGADIFNVLAFAEPGCRRSAGNNHFASFCRS